MKVHNAQDKLENQTFNKLKNYFLFINDMIHLNLNYKSFISLFVIHRAHSKALFLHLPWFQSFLTLGVVWVELFSLLQHHRLSFSLSDFIVCEWLSRLFCFSLSLQETLQLFSHSMGQEQKLPHQEEKQMVFSK